MPDNESRPLLPVRRTVLPPERQRVDAPRIVESVSRSLVKLSRSPAVRRAAAAGVVFGIGMQLGRGLSLGRSVRITRSGLRALRGKRDGPGAQTGFWVRRRMVRLTMTRRRFEGADE